MEIKNHAQLKRAITEGHEFTIVNHHIRPEYNGQRRKPNVIQTNGCYSVVPGDPEHKVSKANGGKGFWLDFGKAKDWKFEGNHCSYAPDGKDVWEIEFDDGLER